jgi:predicted RNase H-like HicB family nuclease
MKLTIELDREADDMWIAEIPELPGTIASGATADGAVEAVRAVARRVLTDRVVHEDAPCDLLDAILLAPARG